MVLFMFLIDLLFSTLVNPVFDFSAEVRRNRPDMVRRWLLSGIRILEAAFPATTRLFVHQALI